jgi:hypothetical protein
LGNADVKNTHKILVGNPEEKTGPRNEIYLLIVGIINTFSGNRVWGTD